VAGEPSDAELLMDWKFGYGDGALDTWTPLPLVLTLGFAEFAFGLAALAPGAVVL
jgi:hypothetical protein